MEYITSGCAAGTMIEYLHGNTNLANQKGETYHNARVKAKEKGKYADMKNLLISIYMHLGYTNAEANKKIEEWSKKKTK